LRFRSEGEGKKIELRGIYTYEYCLSICNEAEQNRRLLLIAESSLFESIFECDYGCDSPPSELHNGRTARSNRGSAADCVGVRSLLTFRHQKSIVISQRFPISKHATIYLSFFCVLSAEQHGAEYGAVQISRPILEWHEWHIRSQYSRLIYSQKQFGACRRSTSCRQYIASLYTHRHDVSVV
jgi:hypothetical protein